MTSLRGNVGLLPASASHRPAAGATTLGPDGRSATPVGLGSRGLGRQLVAFATIGVLSTGAYAVLYLLLRAVTGATTANALALLLTAIGNTAANRRLTFGVRGGRSMLRDQMGGLIALAVALAITTVSVRLLGALAPSAGHLVELAVLVLANALATVARFVLLRSWIAADGQHVPTPAAASCNPQE
jgi:putative flippase GtrA